MTHYFIKILRGLFNLLEQKKFQELFGVITGYDLESLLESEKEWYHHGRDMEEISLLYPDVLFELEGNGEEWDDHWQARYLNGKEEKVHANVRIVYPEFKELLK
jgi:hypothetical protein